MAEAILPWGQVALNLESTPKDLEDGSAYLKSTLVREHLATLEMLWLQEGDASFATRWFDGGGRERRVRAALHGLGLRRAEAVREAGLRLRSVHFSAVYASAKVLIELAPEQCVSARGEVLLRAARPLAVARALGESSLSFRPLIDDAVAVEAYSARADVPDGVLMAHLASRTPRAGLVAAARAARLPHWAKLVVRRIAVDDSGLALGDSRGLALLAAGVAASRAEGRPDMALARWVDLLVGQSLTESASRPAAGSDAWALLYACALVGHVATAERVARHIESCGPTIDTVCALGLLGVPGTAGVLLGTLHSADPRIRREALRALYIMTGQLFVVGGAEGARDDGEHLEADLLGAQSFLRVWPARAARERFHLGLPLALPETSQGSPAPSFQWLRALVSGSPRALGSKLLPGIFDGRRRYRGGFFSVVPPPTFPELARAPAARGIDPSMIGPRDP